ncbi:hypothetical protein [Peribacillus loiseleuriae]|uniref:Sporulation protein n=1 Tax=Peribacillus loiseleuriae TaxID=1679170 RepID=A0A0K9H0D4_9BACI|nr:hypothetical protein [Peribacillus loiseleuriae]KMY51972.1 hypothetical protein AC625_22610 [Peribacillus loiseleuriae]
MKIVWSFVIMALLAGCNGLSNNAGDKNKTNEAATSNLKKVTSDSGHYSNQPADQLLNTPYSVSNVAPSNGDDIEQARKTIEAETNYEAKGVWVNGLSMVVTIDDHGKIKTESEWKKEKKRIHRLLIKAFPRYHVDIKRDH